jgi:hypothetical protein
LTVSNEKTSVILSTFFVHNLIGKVEKKYFQNKKSSSNSKTQNQKIAFYHWLLTDAASALLRAIA